MQPPRLLPTDQLLRNTACHVTGAGLLLTAAGLWYGGLALEQALACFALVALFVLARIPDHAPHQRFGPANSITLARAALVCLLAGLIGSGAGGLADDWTPFLLSLAAWLLDGLDGWLARRQRLESRFGFYFDMEMDALHLMVLCALLYDLERLGAWIFLAGLLRYLFIMAGWRWRWLRRPLPFSGRRKTVAAVQIGILAACLAPALPASAVTLLALAGLVALVYSFSVDSIWLYQHRKDFP